MDRDCAMYFSMYYHKVKGCPGRSCLNVFLLFSSFTPPENGRNMWASQALWLCESSIWYKNREIKKMSWYCVQWCRTLTIDSIVTWFSVDSWNYILCNNMKQSASSCLTTLPIQREGICLSSFCMLKRVSFRNGHTSSGTGMMDVGRRTCL